VRWRWPEAKCRRFATAFCSNSRNPIETLEIIYSATRGTRFAQERGMNAYRTKPKWTEILAARIHAHRFSAFIGGKDIVLHNGETLNLKIQRVLKTPASKLYQVYPYGFITEMSGSGFTEHGCGEAAHPLIAIQKSVSEAVERCLFRHLKNSSSGTMTTNGWATHFSKAKAESAALLELLERDAALVHALREIPFLEIDHETFPKSLLSWENSEMRHTRFSRLRVLLSTAGYFPTLSVVFMDSKGLGVIAHATAQNLPDALFRALAEAARLARIALSGGFLITSKNLFSTAGEVSSLGPSEQAVAYAHHRPLPSWMFGQNVDWKTARSRWSEHIRNYQKNPISYEFISVAHEPLFSGYCKSDDVQDLFFGRTSDAERRGEINRKRLRIEKTEEALSTLPHFVA
jgi:hypothetical protein